MKWNKSQDFLLKKVLDKTTKIHLLVIASYIVITLGVSWFLLRNLGSSILKNDNMLLHWMVSWNIHALFTDPLNILQANIFFPHENTLLYSDLLLPQSIMAIPLVLITGNTILAYNLLILLFFILTAYGTYLLARYYTRHHYASWIAGIIFGFSTYRIISFGHFQNLSIFFIPFAILLLEKYFDTFKSRYSVGFTLLFIGQALASWYNGAFLGFFTIFMMIMHRKEIKEHFKKVLKDFALSMGVFAVLIGPFALAYFKFAREQDSAYPLDLVIKRSADIGGYLIPSPYTIPGKIVSWFGLTKERWMENIHFLGVGPLYLVGYALYKKMYRGAEKNARLYIIGLAVFFILSLGPALHLFDLTLKIPLPYLLIQIIPAFQFIRVISRLAIIVLLCVAIISAFAIKKLTAEEGKQKKWLTYSLAVMLPFSIVFESFDLKRHQNIETDTTCAPIYESVRKDNSVDALVEYPVWRDPFKTVYYVFDSRCHDFTPMFNGYSGYKPEEYPKSITIFETFPSEKSIDHMLSLGIDHVIVHTNEFEKPANIQQKIKNNPQLHIKDIKDGDYFIELLPQ